LSKYLIRYIGDQIASYNSLIEILNQVIIKNKIKMAIFYSVGTQLIDGPKNTGYNFYIIFDASGDAIVLAINRNIHKLYHTMIDYKNNSFSYNWVEY
jgi:hypothetical protein